MFSPHNSSLMSTKASIAAIQTPSVGLMTPKEKFEKHWSWISDQYKPIEHIGKGSFGQVIKA